MRELFAFSDQAVETVKTNYIREYSDILKSDDRLIGIKGGRGVGKTTLMLQYLKTSAIRKNAIYVTLDDLYFTDNKLTGFADDFVRNGGRFLFMDEVHHYNNWSQEVKLIYDRHPDLKMVFTGSSIFQLGKSRGDLSRRAVMYDLPGLSLREFINIEAKMNLAKITLDQLLKKHKEIAVKISSQIKPVEKFNAYNQYGYFPFFLENKKTYTIKLSQIINQVIESDLSYVAGLTHVNIDKLKQLLYIIATNRDFLVPGIFTERIIENVLGTLQGVI